MADWKPIGEAAMRDRVETAFPGASFEVTRDGEVVVYTGWQQREEPEGYRSDPPIFEPPEWLGSDDEDRVGDAERFRHALVEVDMHLAADPNIWRLTAAAKAGDVLCDVLGADVIRQINDDVLGVHLRCPRCGSRNCECHPSPHMHRCIDCGYDGTEASRG